jgi:hypothetical protein
VRALDVLPTNSFLSDFAMQHIESYRRMTPEG